MRLPAPSEVELQHSQRLAGRIKAAIQENPAGSISFRQYMQMALYEPGLGYYVAGKNKLGAEGDFTTAPEISPLFSQCLANQCAQVLQSNPNAQGKQESYILEFGAGSGIMAADILLHLETLGCLPDKYLILELSPELQNRQQTTLKQRAPHLLDKVEWLNSLPDKPFQGIILANEVLDAMPVEMFSMVEGEWFSAGVSINDSDTDANEFDLTISNDTVLAPQPIPAALSEKNWQHYPSPYTSEFNPSLSGWINSLSDVLEQGLVLLIDYGYEHEDYYRPERHRGTLLCHYRHHVHDDVLLWPGLQDITASVDFTAVAKAAETAGLTVSAYTTQANFLFNNGLEPLFNQALDNNPEQQYQLAQQVRTLTLPSEMGERFKVISLTKGFTSVEDAHTLSASQPSDQRHRL